VSPQSIALLASILVAVLFLAWVHVLIRPSLRALLEEVIGLPAATNFYLRAFAIAIAFVGLGAVLGSGHGELKAESRFMEYVWSVAGSLKEVFENVLIVLLVYVGFVTVLMAALRRRQ
jgi:hypothetical protein